MKTYSTIITIILLLLIGLIFINSNYKASYTMNMTIYSHSLCYKYEYTKIEHTPKGETLEYRGENYMIPGVGFIGTGAGVGPDFKDSAGVWDEYKNQIVIDTGMCLYYSFGGSDVDSTFISLYDHPEAINMLNGVVINYEIYTK